MRWWLPRVLLALRCLRASSSSPARRPQKRSRLPTRTGRAVRSCAPTTGRSLAASPRGTPSTTWTSRRRATEPVAINGPYPATVFFPLYPATVAAVAPLVGGDLAWLDCWWPTRVAGRPRAGRTCWRAAHVGARRPCWPWRWSRCSPGPWRSRWPIRMGSSLPSSSVTFLLSASDRRGEPGRHRRSWACLCGLTRLQGALARAAAPDPLLASGRRARFRVSWLAALGPALGWRIACGYIGVTPATRWRRSVAAERPGTSARLQVPSRSRGSCWSQR